MVEAPNAYLIAAQFAEKWRLAIEDGRLHPDIAEFYKEKCLVAVKILAEHDGEWMTWNDILNLWPVNFEYPHEMQHDDIERSLAYSGVVRVDSDEYSAKGTSMGWSKYRSLIGSGVAPRREP